jgi:hypothetical protein
MQLLLSFNCGCLPSAFLLQFRWQYLWPHFMTALFFYFVFYDMIILWYQLSFLFNVIPLILLVLRNLCFVQGRKLDTKSGVGKYWWLMRVLSSPNFTKIADLLVNESKDKFTPMVPCLFYVWLMSDDSPMQFQCCGCFLFMSTIYVTNRFHALIMGFDQSCKSARFLESQVQLSETVAGTPEIRQDL